MQLSTFKDTDQKYFEYMDFVNEKADNIETEYEPIIKGSQEIGAKKFITGPAFKVSVESDHYENATKLLDSYNTLWHGYFPEFQGNKIDIRYYTCGGKWLPSIKKGTFHFVMYFKFEEDIEELKKV